MPRSRSLPALLLTAAFSTACGFSSGLPSDAPGKDLTPAQNKQFCEAQATYVSDALGKDGAAKFACLMGGVIAGALSGRGVEGCQSAYEDCMAQPAEPSESESECSGEATPGCTATVAEMEACVEEATSTITSKLDDATCESVMSDTSLMSPGPKCKIVEEKGCDIN